MWSLQCASGLDRCGSRRQHRAARAYKYAAYDGLQLRQARTAAGLVTMWSVSSTSPRWLV